ncbi:MAG TPA: homoserine kinase [Terracidiphilus sp.]|nr:homoserine kinase [Terracidiphilus sp.]
MMKPLRLRLPATSANLGPGFDAAAIALDFHLNIEAESADRFSIEATGRDAERCARLTDNLVLDTYSRILAERGLSARPLALKMHNEIPLGMGCGSSAAGRLAAIALASHFGELNLSEAEILEEAAALEGHPDNAAACWLGGFVTAATEEHKVLYARVNPPKEWRALVVLPADPLATSQARALLPESYSRRDAVENVQSAALLGLAFAQGRGELLHVAMKDKMHQPFRARVCRLLPPLLPLPGRDGILGVALSGAGPSVLVVLESESAVEKAKKAVLEAIEQSEDEQKVMPAFIACTFSQEGATQEMSKPAEKSSAQ